MKWWAAIYENAKTHFIPDQIKDAVLSNLLDRKCRPHLSFPESMGGPLSEVTEIGLTLGLPCRADDSNMEFDLDGATFIVETREVEYFLAKIQGAQERLEIGTTYYKIHGKWHCVCLLPEHREQLIEMMQEKLPEANAIADLENERFNQSLRRVREGGGEHMIHERPVRKMEKV